MLHRVLNEPIPLLAEARPDLDPKLCAIVMKALEKEPDRRYQTAKELRDALDAFVRDQGVEVRDEAVGDTLATMFQALRDQVAARVKECVVELASRQDEAPMSGSALPSLKLTPQTGESDVLGETLREEPGTPKWAEAVPPSLTTAVATAPPSAGRAPVPSRGVTRTKWAVGVLGAVAIVGTVLVASRGPAHGAATPATPATSATIHVALDSTPSGAAIEKDGQVIGHTPAALDLPGGHHQLSSSSKALRAKWWSSTVVARSPFSCVPWIPIRLSCLRCLPVRQFPLKQSRFKRESRAPPSAHPNP